MRKPLVLLPLMFCLVMSFVGCGGSGSSTVSVSNNPSGGNEFGTVALFVADGPADEYDHLYITITEITLIGGEDQVTVFSGSLEVDLLELRDEDLLLSIRDEVPAGRYEKIRMQISDIRGEGGPCSNNIKLPSGKIDLNPRGGFEVTGGGSLSIRLDLDANKSINLHVAGNSGKCIFRPVVFVDIETGFRQWRCPRIMPGEISGFILDDDEIDPKRIGFTLTLPDNRGAVDVYLAGAAVIFDNDMVPILVSVLKVGDAVSVRGDLAEDGAIDTSLVVVGELAMVRGTALDGVDAENEFVMDPNDGEEVFGPTPVALLPETIVLADCRQPMDPDAIQPDMLVKVLGKIDMGNGVIKAALVEVKAAEVSGEIVAMADALPGDGMDVTIQPASGDPITVFFPAGVPLYLESDGPVSPELLVAGRLVRVVLNAEGGSGLKADEVFVQYDELEGICEDGDTVVIDGQAVEVMAGATILDVAGGQQTPALAADIFDSEYVKCFGLTALPGDPVDFHAYVVLLTDVPDPDE